jgi:preprotein translocase SecE subunit
MGESKAKNNVTTTKNNPTWKIIKYVLGVLGILSIVIAILTVTGLLVDVLIFLKYTGTFDSKNEITVALITSIIGILFLFIAFSKPIDRFFSVIERKELRLSSDDKKSGISIELIFFLTIAAVLVVLAILLGIDYLTVENELPLLGKFTESFIIGSLVILAIVSIVVAFNEIIKQSLKELKKVHWPTGKQMSLYSAQVFTFIIFFSLLFLAFDYLVGVGLGGLTNLLS